MAVHHINGYCLAHTLIHDLDFVWMAESSPCELIFLLTQVKNFKKAPREGALLEKLIDFDSTRKNVSPMDSTSPQQNFDRAYSLDELQWVV